MRFLTSFDTEFFFSTKNIMGPFIYYVMPSEGGRGLAKPADHNTLLHKLHIKGGVKNKKKSHNVICEWPHIVGTKMNKPWNDKYYIQSSNQNNIMINNRLIRKKIDSRF